MQQISVSKRSIYFVCPFANFVLKPFCLCAHIIIIQYVSFGNKLIRDQQFPSVFVAATFYQFQGIYPSPVVVVES